MPAARHDNNFDALRIIGAMMVLISHCWPICFNQRDPTLLGAPLGTMGVYVFFFTSGFLITKSIRSTKRKINFAINRAIRIYPALIVCILATTFLAGPLLSTLPAAEYISNLDTWRYLSNASAIKLESNLPGVFQDNPIPTVNGSLWTLPYEILCYILFSTIIWSTPAKFKSRVILCAALFAVMLKIYASYTISNPSGTSKHILSFSKLLLPFSLGACFTLIKTTSSRSHYRLLLAGIISAAIWYATSHNVAQQLFSTLTVCLITIYIALYTPPFYISPPSWGDFSYGLYIYAFPVQQALAAYFIPADTQASKIAYIACSMAITTSLAITSWHLIEKPALKLKKY